jgi:DNA-directed RNA polymerase subunit D
MMDVGRKEEKEEGGYKMEVKLINKDKEKGKLSFVIKGVDPVFVNTLRRTIMEEVPTLAIEEVEFRDNSSALYDEMVAHRLGLIPIKTDLKSYELPKECTCKGKGCAKCTLKMTLSSKSAGYVYAKEIKSKDSKCVPALPGLPIVKLLKGQKIEFEATAVLGQGKDHAKWSPGLASYKGYPTIEVNSKGESCEEAAMKCPVNVFEFKKGKLTVVNPLNCHFCNACVDVCPDGIQVEESKTDFIFNIESWGQLVPRTIIKEAINRFQKKTDEFVKLLK